MAIGFFLLLLNFSCCSPEVYIKKEHDSYKNSTTYTGVYNSSEELNSAITAELRGSNIITSRCILKVVPYMEVHGDKIGFFGVLVGYHGNDWLYIQEGESLYFDIDGSKSSLNNKPNTIQTEASAGRIWEGVAYYAPLSLIEKIANAKTVQCRLYGKNDNFDKTFDIHEISLFKLILDERFKICNQQQK